ncbi:MAG: hypothetical protein JXX28_14180 [Deltaproteobacteria bacterium]|nr:hypothetical protein [Deltaproteobacteria bacterium]
MERQDLLVVLGAPTLSASLDFARAVERLRCCKPHWPLQTVILDQTAWLDASSIPSMDPEHFSVLTARLGVMVMEVLQGPLERGVRRVSVVLPALELAPVSWALQEHFRTAHGLRVLLQRGRIPLSSPLHTLVSHLYRVDFLLPTLPEAILIDAGAVPVLPLGPAALGSIFRRAAMRIQADAQVLEPPRDWMSVLRQSSRVPLSPHLDQLRRLNGQLRRLADVARPQVDAQVRVVDGWARSTPREENPDLALLAQHWWGLLGQSQETSRHGSMRLHDAVHDRLAQKLPVG